MSDLIIGACIASVSAALFWGITHLFGGPRDEDGRK